ncbi:hypothetical protein PHYC_00787 [Phycisphaerales bacterium]|nr:hypothetical protein PHYC_00787 [Phycisphaerales bacterium]
MRSRPVRTGTVLAAAVLSAAAGSFARADDVAQIVTARERVLNLRTGDVDTRLLPDRLLGEAFGAGRYVFTLDGPMSPGREAALRGIGIRVLGYLPWHGLIVEAPAVNPAAVLGLGFVTWAGEYRDEWKIEPELLNGARIVTTDQRLAIAAEGKVVVNVWLFAGSGAEGTLASLSAMEGVQIGLIEMVGGSACLHAAMPRAGVGALAGLPDVQFVEETAEYLERSNATTRWVVQSDQSGVTTLYDHGLAGTGQVVGIIDGKVAVNHCAFYDPVNPIGPLHRKILAYNTTFGYNLHGTHVACTAVGDGGDWGDTRGIAYLAKLVHSGYPSPTEESVYGVHQLHTQQGARIHSNSWGADWTRAYDGGCRGIDSVSRDYQDILIVHAVSDSSQVTNPENAKNSLAVAATSNAPSENNWCFGGAGPTQDGRRKPEIMAPGCAIFSASGSAGCGLAGLSGTSMACPAVAGTAALVRQYYTDGFYPGGAAGGSDSFAPSGQLVKATLVNSAVDITGESGFPSNREGWGRVLADNGLYFAGDSRRLVVRDVRNDTAGAIVTGQASTLRVDVESGQSLKITLAWADAPAEVNATYVPVNDLDLRAVSPSGAVYLGNVFAGGESVPGGAADPLNNLEQVLLSAPEAGEWSIEVSGSGVNVGAQGFAIVVTGGVMEHTCDADVNCDGALNGFDIEVMERAVNGDLADFCQPSADFNRDGSENGFDVEAIEQVVNGGPCP